MGDSLSVIRGEWLAIVRHDLAGNLPGDAPWLRAGLVASLGQGAEPVDTIWVGKAEEVPNGEYPHTRARTPIGRYLDRGVEKHAVAQEVQPAPLSADSRKVAAGFRPPDADGSDPSPHVVATRRNVTQRPLPMGRRRAGRKDLFGQPAVVAVFHRIWRRLSRHRPRERKQGGEQGYKAFHRPAIPPE